MEEEDDRKMNDSTMPPPKVKTKTSALDIPSSSSSSATARKKSGRFGLAEWNRLLAVSKDLAQRRDAPLRKIRMSEIQQHNQVHDGWVVVRGKVYFLTPYLAYHPGGEAILRKVLGQDATALYDKYHRWVSEDG